MRSDTIVEEAVALRRFIVVWQNPVSRKFVAVGDLEVDHREGDVIQSRFSYRSDELAGEFHPFLAFPRLQEDYKHDGDLFAFFSNRVMSAGRPDFGQYISALGLTTEQAGPVEILARSGGERATDTIQVVPYPDVLDDGTERRLFLVSGVRHIDGADERIAGLVPGQRLELREEPNNVVNPKAVLIDASEGAPIGWVPDYLIEDLSKYREDARPISVSVIRANGPEVPAHLRVLCQMDVQG